MPPARGRRGLPPAAAREEARPAAARAARFGPGAVAPPPLGPAMRAGLGRPAAEGTALGAGKEPFPQGR